MTRKKLYLSPPHMGPAERQLLIDAFDSNWLGTLGPEVDAFEREFAELHGIEGAAALANGTAGLHLALVMLGVGPGDEVFCSDLTFAASTNVIAYQGATPVFIDSERTSWNMDPALLAEELEACARRGKLPKVVIVVDLYGQCADFDPILEACARHGVPVVEDAAESLGAEYRGRPAGTLADIGVFSFNGNKIITTSGGGMLVARRRDWVDRARYLANQARDPVPHYQHSVIGYNYRLSNLLAAIGRGQLRVLSERVAQRRANNAFYRAALGGMDGIEFMPEAAHGRSTFWLTSLTIDPARFGATSEEVRVALNAVDIEARPVWKPMHLQPVFGDYRLCGGAVSTDLFERGICLPSGSNLTDEDRARVVDAVLSVPRGLRR
jgi:pyridoxal phosphate-dependent aminotransferase EpsN